MIQQQVNHDYQQIPLVESGGLPTFIGDIGEGKIPKSLAVIALSIASGFCGLGIIVGKQIGEMQLRSAEQEAIIQKGKATEYQHLIHGLCEKANRTGKK